MLLTLFFYLISKIYQKLQNVARLLLCEVNQDHFDNNKSSHKVAQPRIELGSLTYEAGMLPLHHCALIERGALLQSLYKV